MSLEGWVVVVMFVFNVVMMFECMLYEIFLGSVDEILFIDDVSIDDMVVVVCCFGFMVFEYEQN